MPRKKSSIKEKSLLYQERTELFTLIEKLADNNRYSVTPSGATKSWMTISKRCSKQLLHQYPQLTELSIDYDTPEPLLGYYAWNNWVVKVTDESTTIDPYDARNRGMKFNYVRKPLSGYALSSQGALVQFRMYDGMFMVTNICKTRSVPSSTNVKFFKEYLLKSDGDVLLVFLIYQKSLSLVDEIEVFKLDYDSFELVKVNRLHGKALFLEKGYCLSVNAGETGCRDNCVFFTDGSENDEWRMYDMESGSISPDCGRSPKSTWGPRTEE